MKRMKTRKVMRSSGSKDLVFFSSEATGNFYAEEKHNSRLVLKSKEIKLEAILIIQAEEVDSLD